VHSTILSFQMNIILLGFHSRTLVIEGLLIKLSELSFSSQLPKADVFCSCIMLIHIVKNLLLSTKVHMGEEL
jgi:hypothetical protein